MIAVACLIWWAAVALVIRIPPSTAKVNSSDVAVVKMEFFIHRMKPFAADIETDTAIVTRRIKSTAPSMVFPVLKVVTRAASSIASYLGFFNIFTVIYEIIGLFENSQSRVQEQLEELIHGVNLINEKLDDLKNAFIFHQMLSRFNEVENAVENGDKKLKQILQYMVTKKSQREVLKLKEEYVNHYDRNNIDLLIDSLIRMSTRQETETQNNIFDRLIEEKGCDVYKLSMLMIQVKRLAGLAAQQVLAYHLFKGDDDRAAKSFTDMARTMYRIRLVYKGKVVQCMGNTRQFAQDDVLKLLKSMRNNPDETVVEAVYSHLAERYPWYSWAVASIDKDDRSHLHERGETYFTAEDGVKRMLVVVYDDVKSYPSCSDLPTTQTLVRFSRCDDCRMGRYIKASEETFLTKQRCDTLPGHEYKHDFIAAGTRASLDPCVGFEKCNDNGLCSSVPHTNTFLCKCNEFVEGDSCDVTVNPDDSVLELIASMRESIKYVLNVPTVVDTYFEIRNLSTQIDSLRRDMISLFDHSQNVMKHWEVIKDVELLVDIYIRMKNGDTHFDTFGDAVAKHLLTVSELELKASLYNMILAKGLLSSPGDDFYNSFKKQWLAKNPQSGCSEEYNNAVSGLMRGLALLDQSLGEVLIFYREWLIKKYGKSQKQRDGFLNEANRLKTEFESRQIQYQDYWGMHSCGKLKLSEVTGGRFCKDLLSYEGMKVTKLCTQQRMPESIAYVCKTNGTSLRWVPEGKCRYQWSAWGSWGSCSRSCGGGLQTRRRTCKGTASIEDCMKDNNNTPRQEQRQCNTKYCCGCCSANDKFKCPTGKCIPRAYLCNGDNDCGDNADESHSQCPGALRSGNIVALRNDFAGKWLGCWHWTCYPSSCDVYGRRWSECTGEKFRIISLSRDVGTILRHGDEIGIQYNIHRDNWISCWQHFFSDSQCGRSTCPGNRVPTSDCVGEQFKIFSPDRKSQCSTDTRHSCRGEYIREDDYVFIHYIFEGKWLGLSSSATKVSPTTCSGVYLDWSDISGCQRERWRIVTG